MWSRFRFYSSRFLKIHKHMHTQNHKLSLRHAHTSPDPLHTIPVHGTELNGIFNGLQGSSVAGWTRQHQCCSYDTTGTTGAVVESDWANLPAGLMLSPVSSLLRMRSLSRPSPDPYLAWTKKKKLSVCWSVRASECKVVGVFELRRSLGRLSKAFKHACVCMCACWWPTQYSLNVVFALHSLIASFLLPQENMQPQRHLFKEHIEKTHRFLLLAAGGRKCRRCQFLCAERLKEIV